MAKKLNLIREKILRGLDLTHKKLIQSKRERNLDLVVSKNGKVIRLDSKDL